ncbi:MAG: 50S ribosomal protein L14 [Candidatus Parcubacteria bacterium]|nr:50S ribosomal protein L14 [Candidatus Parcubacteria bacterium]
MIQLRTMLKVADNSGARLIQCFHVMGSSGRKYAQIGDVIVATVKKADPRKLVKKHEIVRAVIVRQRKALRRSDGTYVRFDDNAAVILEGKTKEPKGVRVFGPVAKEVREKGFEKVSSLAEEIV